MSEHESDQLGRLRQAEWRYVDQLSGMVWCVESVGLGGREPSGMCGVSWLQKRFVGWVVDRVCVMHRWGRE